MKKVVFVLAALIVILLSAFSASAVTPDDILEYQKENLGLSDIEQAIPDSVRDNTGQLQLDPDTFQDSLTIKNVVGFLVSLFASSIKSGVGMFAGLMCISVAASVISMYAGASGNANTASCVRCVMCLACAVCVYAALYGVYGSVKDNYAACASFAEAFVPVFSAAVSASGYATAAASFAASYTGAIALFAWISSSLVPMCLQIYTVLGLAHCCSGNEGLRSASLLVKRVCVWGLLAVSCILNGVIGLNVSVSASGDGVSMQTVKFVLGTVIPFVGSTASESAEAVFSCSAAIKGSMGALGMLVIFCILVPSLVGILTSLGAVRIVMAFNDLVGNVSISSFLSYISDSLQITTAVCVCSAIVLITGLGIATGVGG